MKLLELFNPFPEAMLPEENPEVSGIQLDSRAIKPGDVFVALTGSQRDGRKYISSAVDAGALAILVDTPLVEKIDVPVVVLADLQSKLGAVATHFFKHPSSHLALVGVTGTNGKSSVCEYIRQLSEALGKKSASIGTLGFYLGEEKMPLINTTPDVLSVNALLAQCADKGASLAAMEVSSHALVQQRVQGVVFDTAVFTNLSQDHLDYHHSMVEYARAKSELFKLPGLSKAIINIDDGYSDLMLAAVPTSVDCYQFSLKNSGADAYLSCIEWQVDGVCEAQLHLLGECERIRTSLIGEFNLYNLLAAALVLRLQGFSLASIAEGIAFIRGVDGRMEKVSNHEGILALVDYAHTPDALENVLKTLNAQRKMQQRTGQIYTVFGCGGDRDKGKRPQMGKVASLLSDHVWVTSDNPRSEEPMAICRDVVEGIDKTNFDIIESREAAIHAAVYQARVGDILLVAGKGHEKTQTLGADVRHFDDVEELHKAFARKMAENKERACH
ncbi:MAG: UDP-N-acetylmuramoyl-L-alanyl-D-glutamate--2,6-diaminopimelate ligase [Cellvibrionales bacterium]|nr:UDP-N-acetylmuramoyl-L-alanyl-D-glutamate--2,6-diaminopimelate ligase [Cellvibrionales bacterium]